MRIEIDGLRSDEHLELASYDDDYVVIRIGDTSTRVNVVDLYRALNALAPLRVGDDASVQIP